MAIYRLWKCTGEGIVENQGLAAVSDRNPNLVENEMRSGRNYWFPRRSNRTKRQCVFYDQEADRDQDLRVKEGRYRLFDGVSPLIYDLGPNNTKGLNLTRGGVWLDSRQFKDTLRPDVLKRMPVWPANDLTNGLTMALEFQHTSTRVDSLYESQWNDAEDHGGTGPDGACQTGDECWKVQQPAYPLLYRNWPDYNTLKEATTSLYYAQKQEVRDTYVRKKDPDLSIAGYRTNVDWMVYDAFSAIRLIEEFGEQLEHDRSLGLDGHASPLRTDLCECHNVIKCPNGTSSPIGASSLNDCKPCCSGVAGESAASCYTSETTTCRKTGSAMVLRRYDLIPSYAVDDYNKTNFVIKAPGTMGAPVVPPYYSFGEGGTYGGRPCKLGDTFEDEGQRVKCKAADEFADLTGKKSGEPGASLGHLRLWTFDIATITSDLRKLERNFTYGAHYRLAVYEDCKPCPTEYACQFTGDYDPVRGYDCSEPKGPTQILRYRKCLEENTQRYCVNASYPFKNVVLPGADCERLVNKMIVSGTPEMEARHRWAAGEKTYVPMYGPGTVLACAGQNDERCFVALDMWEYNRDAAEIYVSAWILEWPDTASAQSAAAELRAKLEFEKPECTLYSIPGRPATTPGCGGPVQSARIHEYGHDGVEWELPRLANDQLSTSSLRGPGDFYLEMDIHPGWRWTTTGGVEKVIPENEVGNEARILEDDEVGPGVRRFSLPDRRLCARTPFYCKTRSHSPFEFLTLPVVTEASEVRGKTGYKSGTGLEISAVLGTAAEIEQAALEELIKLEEDVGDELLCSATVETDEFAAKQAVLQFQKMKTLPDDPPGVRWCAPVEKERPPMFAEEVLREVVERPGQNPDHKDELLEQEHDRLDENFFLYNDVPDTGMWRQSDFRRAIQQQGCCLCEDKRKRLPRFFRETTKNPGLEDNKHALVQTTYTMVGRLYVDLTICWELLSGLYYQEFEAMLDASDVAIHRPSRVNEGTDWAYTTKGELVGPAGCRETTVPESGYYERGNCGVPHYVYGGPGKVLTEKDVIPDSRTDRRYAAADQFLLEEGARSSFLTILAHDLMEENKIEMPMNMPFTTLPPSKGDLLLKYPRILETRVIINRPSDVDVADPNCPGDSPLACVQRRGNPLMDVMRCRGSVQCREEDKMKDKKDAV